MTGSAGAIAVLQSVNERALACWVKSGDRDFAAYRLVPELDTQVGKPRILVVDKGKAQGLPAMVIEASGQPVRLSTYGRLAAGPLAGRINGDVARWASGAKACQATTGA